MAKKIYLVTTTTNLEIDENGLLYIGDARSPGWFLSKEDAIKCIEENWGDIWETVYNFAFIEEIPEGIYECNKYRKFYKWSPKEARYMKIEEPGCVKGYNNLGGIG